MGVFVESHHATMNTFAAVGLFYVNESRFENEAIHVRVGMLSALFLKSTRGDAVLVIAGHG